jgi:hypothetical protein
MKKLLISFLVGLTVFLSFAPYLSPAKAQTTTWYNQTFQEWYGKVYDPSNPSEIFGERYTAAQVQWIIYGVWGFLINSITGPQNAGIIQCFLSNVANISTCTDKLSKIIAINPTQNQAVVKRNASPKSILGLILTSDRPLSGISYVKEKLQTFNLVPVAHAQAIGFGFNTALKPIQDMWKTFRDVAFGLFVIVAIVFAFMIMFRVKLSPQTVISVQSALPKIVVSLILVTFSYAIAGFLVDLMYVVIGLLSTILAPLIPNIPLLQPSQYKAIDVFTLLTSGQTLDPISKLIGGGGILGLIFTYLVPLIFVFLLLFAVGLLASETGVGVIVSIFFFVAILIVIIVGLWIGFKTIWALFKAFTKVVLLTIFAPIQLALGTLIPNFGFGQWLRSYLSNLSVFVVTGVLWLLAWIFGLLAWRGLTTGTSIILPVASTDTWPPLLGTSEFGTTLLFAGVSFVLFTMIPKTTELVQSFLAGKPFDYGTAIGEALGPVSTTGRSGAAIFVNKNREADERTRRAGGVPPARIFDTILENTLLRRK